MFLGIPRAKAHTYVVITPPATTPISMATAKAYLKITTTDDDDLITALITAATDFAEKYIKKDLITKTWKTFRDDFFFDEIILRRSPLQTVDRFEYLVATVLTPVPSTDFYNTVETDYSRIALEDGERFPTDGDVRLQSIEIDFKTGFGDTEADIPEDIKTGLLAHIAMLFENRGDCFDCGCAVAPKIAASLPLQSAAIYNQYRILDFKVGVA